LKEEATCVVKAKFHYAIWFEGISKLVRRWSATSFEPASVMEFGSKSALHGHCRSVLPEFITYG